MNEYADTRATRRSRSANLSLGLGSGVTSGKVGGGSGVGNLGNDNWIGLRRGSSSGKKERSRRGCWSEREGL